MNLTATAASGWRFKNWSGDKTGTSAATTITMNGNKTVTANFVQRHLVTHEVVYDGYITPAGGLRDHGQSVSFNRKKHNRHEEDFDHWSGLPDSFSTPEWGVGTSMSNPVSFVVEGPRHLKAYDETQIVTLTADVDASGCVECTVDPEEKDYVLNATATVTATPGAGWGFARWEGDVPSGMEEDNPLVMTMNDDKEVTAVFGQVTLTTDAEEGGTVDPEPGEHYYPLDDFANITATAETGWRFAYWEGDVPTEDIETNPLNLEMDEDKEVTAVFSVLLEVDAPETVTVEIPDPLIFNWQWFMPGDTVELLATPDPGYVVAFWEVTTFYPESSGGGGQQALSGGGGAPADNKRIYPGNHAAFSINHPSLAVPIVREVGQFYLLVESQWEEGESVGHVDVSANAEMVGEPVDLGQGRVLYTFNEYVDAVAEPPQRVQVTLEAAADESGWAFDEWDGDIVPYSPDANPITLTMDEDKHVIASFADTVYLTVQVEGEGGVSVDPDKDAYDVGEEVDLVADPVEGWMFDHWEGDLSGDQDSKTIEMDEDKDVIAVFVPMHLVSVETRYEGEVTPPNALYEDGEEQAFTHLPVLSSNPPPFHHWEGLPEDQFPDGPVGPGSSSQNPVTITIHDSHHLIAVEGPATYTLEVTTEGQGTVEPEEGTYPAGSTVSIVPTPADCTWFFDHWEGDLDGSDIPGKIEMDDDKEVVAVFTQNPQIQVKQGDRFIRESSSDSDGDGLPDNLATISPSPSMPELTAQLKNVSSGCSVKWKVAIEYERSGVPNTNGIFNTYYYPRNGNGEPEFTSPMPANQPWDIVFDSGFLGGNATITYELAGSTEEFKFKIGGTNPSDPIAKNFIVSNSGEHWYAYAIAKHETRLGTAIYNQFFLPGSNNQYLPVFGAPRGFGMMQLDPARARARLWHWKLNVLEGMERLDEKRWGANGANAWLLRQIKQQQAEAPAKELRFEVFTYNGVEFQEGTPRTPLDACTIQAFNGVPDWTIRWNNAADEWEQVSSGYVDEVCNELEE